jgi:hypothetical protein
MGLLTFPRLAFYFMPRHEYRGNKMVQNLRMPAFGMQGKAVC